MSPRVGIVVLNWNGGAQTVACIESLVDQSYENKFVIVVDNASSPSERLALQQRYAESPLVELVFLDSNRGYAGGNNEGLSIALRQGADMVLIATQDTQLYPGVLGLLVETAGSNTRIGIVGPMVVDVSLPQRVLSVGECVVVPLLCMPRTIIRHRQVNHPWHLVTGILGCVMLLTRACLEAVGLFDETLFAYYEEVDLCLRARHRGFLIACNTQAVVTHDGMRGFRGGLTPLSAELKARNLLRVMRRYAQPFDWLLLVPSCILLFAGSAVLYTLRGRLDIVAALLRGLAAGVAGQSGPPDALPPAH
jgi:hypothetical protein